MAVALGRCQNWDALARLKRDIFAGLPQLCLRAVLRRGHRLHDAEVLAHTWVGACFHADKVQLLAVGVGASELQDELDGVLSALYLARDVRHLAGVGRLRKVAVECALAGRREAHLPEDLRVEGGLARLALRLRRHLQALGVLRHAHRAPHQLVAHNLQRHALRPDRQCRKRGPPKRQRQRPRGAEQRGAERRAGQRLALGLGLDGCPRSQQANAPWRRPRPMAGCRGHSDGRVGGCAQHLGWTCSNPW
mmetsp:Transcript_37198/g.93512  ORF Transcript_37198/g.93512 Transcript_37198/m.93512 type:complete len:249 (+) Transcript_37198:90-836(+)